MAVCLAASFLSCGENKWHRYLVGVWIIDSINYKGDDITKCLISNGMGFRKDNSLLLPSAQYVCSKFNEPVQTGTFKTEEISADSAIIEFSTDNHFFNGKHL